MFLAPPLYFSFCCYKTLILYSSFCVVVLFVFPVLVESENVFGKCLVLPKDEREKVIPALAHALINWRITSNQARTFSIMETLAIAVSDNANTLAGAIRAKLIDDGGDKPKAKPIVDEKAGAELFVALPCAAYIVVENESADALEAAEKHLIHLMQSFDYENQC